MNVYDLGQVPWRDSQLLYHALPRVGGSGLILLSPATPYVCIGYHQDAAQEVDLEFCRERDIPVFRREVGGGAVYLDGDQLFYQLVLPLDHPLAQGMKETVYQRLLAAVVATFRAIGIAAEYKPINDILVDRRKISGNGAAEIAGHLVLVGNLILNFDFEMMARVLRVPDEKFRDKVFKALRENLTTIRSELRDVPPLPELKQILVQEFARLLGPLTVDGLPTAVYDKARELAPVMTSPEWLQGRSRAGQRRTLKVRDGVSVMERAYKAPGGLIRAVVSVREGRIEDVELSGDFFVYPAERLHDIQRALVGLWADQAPRALERFYATHTIETPGVTAADFARAIGV